jgi:hypothetical protein
VHVIKPHEASVKEVRPIRRACQALGADQELTALVVASHLHDRSLLDVMVADGGDLLDYVRYKLRIWEAIFADSPEDPPVLDCHSDDEPRTRLR